MAGKYFQKSRFVDFFNRFTRSELQQRTSFSKRYTEDNRIIQKVSGLWQYLGWNSYRRQIQETMRRLFEVPVTRRLSLRRAKRNVLQLLADSRKQIRDVFRNGETPTAELQPNQQLLKTDSVSLMEKGTFREAMSEPQFSTERRENDILSQYNRDTTFEQEQRFTGRATKTFPIQANLRSSAASATYNLRNKRTLPIASESSKLNSAVSLRTPESDVPRALMLSLKPNDESPQPQQLLNKSDY